LCGWIAARLAIMIKIPIVEIEIEKVKLIILEG